MKREIKFRAWVPSEKCMIGHREVIERAHLQFSDSLNDSDIVMQFTGLLDKNGKEIYEGDIMGGEPHGTAAVRWSDQWGCFEAYWNEDMFDESTGDPVTIERTSLFANELSDCKDAWIVIGNVFENPDLLK